VKLRRWVTVCVVLVIALSAVSALAVAKDKVLYDRDGNALVALGGAKGTAPARSSSSAVSLTAVGGDYYFYMHAVKQIAYGDSYVRTEFWTDIWTGLASVTEQWVDVSGDTTTSWLGTWPQYYSTKIRLDESWKFGGVSVSVTTAPGLGFSVSSTTVTWSGDCAGDYWALTHTYSGVSAQGFLVSSVRQNSNGSHFFRVGRSGSPEWVSANATKGISTYIG
jgi:hypothetical protein